MSDPQTQICDCRQGDTKRWIGLLPVEMLYKMVDSLIVGERIAGAFVLVLRDQQK